jgi:DNA-binding HxlR family transcriptional regulator
VPAGSPRSCSIEAVQEAFRALEGRWKLLILFHLFERERLRFSELRRLIPAVTEKMLAQQLQALAADGLVLRIDHRVVPPHVEYELTDQGAALKPALEALLDWSALRA